MLQYITAYISAIVVFLAIDYVWLAIVAKDFFRSNIGHLMMDEVNMPIAAGFYLMYGIGIVIFAVAPALLSDQWKHAAIYGALFGFFCYATYDFTNMATLKDWPVLMAAIDISWGTFLTGAAATASFFITRAVIKLI